MLVTLMDGQPSADWVGLNISVPEKAKNILEFLEHCCQGKIVSSLPDGLSSGFLGPCGPVAKIVSSPMAGWTDHLLVNSFILNTQDRLESYDQDYLNKYHQRKRCLKEN